MICNTKQSWAPGEIVKVGFLRLRVCAAIPTPGDSMPDAYALCSTGAEPKYYRFVPHCGLERCASLEQAMAA